jgi:single-stranded DNA-binding protein
MSSLSVTGIARLTRDPDIRRGEEGSWLNFNIASFRNKVQPGKQEVDFFDASYYSKNQDLTDMLKKGTLIYIEYAILKNEQYKAKDGSDRSKIKLLINRLEIMNSEHLAAKEEKETKTINPSSIHPSDLGPPSCGPKVEKVVIPAKEEEYIDEEPPF